MMILPLHICYVILNMRSKTLQGINKIRLLYWLDIKPVTRVKPIK